MHYFLSPDIEPSLYKVPCRHMNLGISFYFKDEPDSIDKENDASNDSNKENHFPIKSDPQPGKI